MRHYSLLAKQFEIWAECPGTVSYTHLDVYKRQDPNCVLGHGVLENRDEGVYAYCSFNDSESGQAAKKLVQHGDVDVYKRQGKRLSFMFVSW